LIPRAGTTNEQWVNAINPTTGAAKVLGNDYIQASLGNTLNSGTYNVKERRAHIIGQSLTIRHRNGSVEPNPTMNFLIGVDDQGEYTSTRLISYGGLVYGIRSDKNGINYGMEQSTPSTDARFDLVEESGRCNNIYNTSSNLYVVNHIGIDAVKELFFVSVKAGTPTNLLTIDIGQAKLISTATLPNPNAVRITMCFDQVTSSLYSLERLTSAAADTTLLRYDPKTATPTTIATIKGRMTVADCNSGFLFATGTNAGATGLAIVDLSSGAVTQQKLTIGAPQSLIFWPQ